MSQCETCESNEATMRVTITNLEGILLDMQLVCAECVPEGYQVGECYHADKMREKPS